MVHNSNTALGKVHCDVQTDTRWQLCALQEKGCGGERDRGQCTRGIEGEHVDGRCSHCQKDGRGQHLVVRVYQRGEERGKGWVLQLGGQAYAGGVDHGDPLQQCLWMLETRALACVGV